MSQPKTYEAATIEEALRAVSIDLGDEIEIVSAVKERRGGMFGFFAKERFVVTAQPPGGDVEDGSETPEDFGDILLSLTAGVEDTWEGSTPIESHSTDDAAPSPAGFTSVIDLRSGKRTLRPAEANGAPTPAPSPAPAPSAEPADEPFSFNSERPSQLRRRIRAAEIVDTRPPAVPTPEPDIHVIPDPPEPATVLSVAGPLHNLGDSAPNWSLVALRDMGLPMSLLETVQEFDPASDIEWMHALAIAIDRMLPEDDTAPHLSWVVGEGRSSAVELVRGIPFGRLPAAIVLPGRQVRATPDELALSLRECIR
jgi:hypothetical protein